MNKTVKIIMATALVGMLSACTSVQRFSTDRTITTSPNEPTANLRVVTNTDIYAIPNSTCISLEKEVYAINRLSARDPDRGWFEKAKYHINTGNKIDMQYSDIKKDMSLEDRPYVVQEYKIPAGKPFTLFSKKEGEMIDLLFKDSNDVYAFGGHFTPENGKNYELLFKRNVSSYQTARQYVTDYSYVIVLYEYQNGEWVRVNEKTNYSKACKN